MKSSEGPSTPVDFLKPLEVNMGKSDTYNLLEASIDEDRPLRIVAIGAGFSGILAGIRWLKHMYNKISLIPLYIIPQRMKNVELVIYEKNYGVGGTWFSNRYPVWEHHINLSIVSYSES